VFEVTFTVKFKVLSGFRNFKDLYELVGTRNLVGFAGSKSRRNVLDAFRGEDNRLTFAACTEIVPVLESRMLVFSESLVK